MVKKGGVWMFPRGEKNEAYQAVFTGVSYLASLVDESLPVSVSHVTFEPETRNHWHIHDGGYQILLVTEGEGCYQEEGRPARHLHAGDVVVTHDGVKHWHGATRSSWFSHIAITAGTPIWLEAVSDEQYELTE